MVWTIAQTVSAHYDVRWLRTPTVQYGTYVICVSCTCVSKSSFVVVRLNAFDPTSSLRFSSVRTLYVKLIFCVVDKPERLTNPNNHRMSNS
jgi:hypothetical protein